MGGHLGKASRYRRHQQALHLDWETVTDFQDVANLDFILKSMLHGDESLAHSPWILNLLMSLNKLPIPSRAALNLNTPHLSLSTCWHKALSVVNVVRQLGRGQRYVLSRCLGLARWRLRASSVPNVP